MKCKRMVDKTIQVEEKYITCDRCGSEITSYLGKRYDETITFNGVGVGPSYEYVQATETFDCCIKCREELITQFKQEIPF